GQRRERRVLPLLVAGRELTAEQDLRPALVQRDVVLERPLVADGDHLERRQEERRPGEHPDDAQPGEPASDGSGHSFDHHRGRLTRYPPPRAGPANPLNLEETFTRLRSSPRAARRRAGGCGARTGRAPGRTPRP